MNIEQKRRQECEKSNCKFYELKCLVFHGNLCIKIDGNRIPLMRSGERSYPTQTTSLVKPSFKLIDGWCIEDILRNEG